MACWSCERPEGKGVFCDKCGAILPLPAGRTYFEVMELSPSYDVLAEDLERRYKGLAKKLHPDRFARADSRARCFALEHSASLNDAYRTLRDPVRRAEYLLRLDGGALGVAHLDGDHRVPSMSSPFLAEMLEIQESLAEARAEGQSDRVEEIKRSIETRRNEELQAVASEFRHPSDGSLRNAAERIARVRYYDRVLDAAAGREVEL